MRRILKLLFATIILLYSCSSADNGKSTLSDQSYTDEVKYAHGFRFINHQQYREIEILQPYDSAILIRYYLVKDANISTPNDGIRMQVPLQNIGIASCTHIGFMEALGLLDHISGVCLPEKIYSPAMQKLYSENKAIDMGDAMQINPERAILAHADAVMISGYGQGDVNPERLNTANIKIIYNNEWTEKTPLGRAEWIKLVGSFFDKDSLADAVFADIEHRYIAMIQHRQELCRQTERPTIMSGNNFRGTWYMSSGDSFMGRLFADAGADYYFSNDSTTGSIPLTIESVLQHFSNADVWVGSNGNSLDELAQSDDKHTWFKAFKDKRVYNFYRRRTPTGANDYWERGVVHPEELLSDLIWALYPQTMPDYQPIYISQLQ